MKHYRFERKSLAGALALLVGVVVLLATATTASAQQDKKDNTGTNPVNFTFDFRLITEMRRFPDDGGSLTLYTAELEWPLGKNIANLEGELEGTLFSEMGTRFQGRFRAYHMNASFNNPDPAFFGETTEISGIGDFDARFLAIAYTSDKFVLAPGLEAFFDTSSLNVTECGDRACPPFLGSGKTSLGPVVFAVFPGLVGPRSLFAPGYQYVFDIAGDSDRADISRSQIDLYFVWVLAQGKNWLLLDPQIILDHENDTGFTTIEAEWGFMIAPKSGVSGYFRPGWGIGSDRPYSWNLEVAAKFVWR